MEQEQEKGETLNIRCPNCRQRFNVTLEFMNTLVECGGCDHQFRITEDVIIRNKKVYPGERKGPNLQRFQRVPLSVSSAPDSLMTMRYENFNSPEKLEPASPQRIIAGIAGVAAMIFTALILLSSRNPGSTFSSMPFENKLIIGGFISVLGFVLLVYANPRARVKAGLVAILFAVAIFCIPLFLTERDSGPSELQEAQADLDASNVSSEEEEELALDPLEVLRERFITKPLEEQQERLDESNGGLRAFGIYLNELVGRNKYTVRDYLIRQTGADLSSSYLYPRGGRDYLMVLSGIDVTDAELEDIVSRLGMVTEIHPEISIIVTRVDNEQFLSGSVEKLNDRTDPAFYQLNQRELKSIDLDRVESAVARLADSEPKILRSDITPLLIELLNQPGVTFHDTLSQALLKWAEDPIPAAEVGLVRLNEKVAQDQPIPEELVALVAKGGQKEAIPTIAKLWETRPILWERYLASFGQAAEPLLLEKLSSEQPPVRRSAVKLLGEVGSEASIPALKEIISEAKPEIRLLAERAIENIENR